VNSDRPNAPVVIVPEGLAFDGRLGRTLDAPSFVGEAVLHHVLERYAERNIFVAPANSFGGPSPEHEVMAAWLKARGCPNVQTPHIRSARYIDTWGNAVELRSWLKRRAQWPLEPIVLVAAFRHARRARLCFLRNGYTLGCVDAVPYKIKGAPIVPRLFYYNRPRLHQIYEAFALFRDALRPEHRG
jgi:uncharacterized SAM-binding protein YcdF (DUF218 family)